MKYDVLVASNDHERARRDGRRRAAELGVDAFAVTHVAALGFGEGALEEPGSRGSVEVVLRIETEDAGDGRVRGSAGVVAVVPTKDHVDAFITERSDVGARVVYFGTTCPVRLSWTH